MSPLHGLIAVSITVLPISAEADDRGLTVSGEMQVVALEDSIYVLSGAGGNMLVSTGDEGLLLVDSDYEERADSTLAAVGKLAKNRNWTVINTHWHWDHSGGNEKLAGRGARIFAHEKVRARMSSAQRLPSIGHTQPAAPMKALPDVTFNDEITLHMNSRTVWVFHAGAAHTDGDVVVYVRGSNVIHTGDIFFNGRYPFIDIDSGGSIDGLIAACRRVLEIVDDETRIVPGHGPLANKGDFEAYTRRLEYIQKAFIDLISREVTLDSILDDDVLGSEYGDDWGGRERRDRFAESVFASMTGTR